MRSSGEMVLVSRLSYACIAGQLPGVEGSVKFKGREITRLTPVELARRGIGRHFRFRVLFLT